MKLKQHSIFFINVQLLKFFGINFYYFLKQVLTFLNITPQAAFFGLTNESDNNLNILQNHILLIFKVYI